ncbi:hypothetical protein R1flu_007163 [Riccia fluitans]|uniref:Uncharacterized protein n=1 Tax=Riccia fluitans TaxID=41844 RepID=A0ABD1YZ69_9MARC
MMKRKVQFTELQLLRVVKGDCRQSKSGVFLEQVEGSSHFVLFCQMLNPCICTTGAFSAQLARLLPLCLGGHQRSICINSRLGDTREKTVSRQIKALGVCNEATCLGHYLAHLYNHFHEMDAEEKEDSKKRKALIQTISDFDTKTEDEKEPTEEVSCIACEGEASGSKPLAQKITVDYDDWGICLESLGRETLKLFEAFHVEVGSVTTKAMARNMKEIFAPPPIVEVDI